MNEEEEKLLLGKKLKEAVVDRAAVSNRKTNNKQHTICQDDEDAVHV